MIASLKPVLSRLRPAGAVPVLSPALLRSLVPLVALAVGVTALVLMFMWRDQSSYKPVFGHGEKVAVADMMAALDAAGVAYRLHPETGQVLVPEGRLGEVRMMLAGKGVTAQLPAGLELMDRNDPLGVSQFVQDVRFRRGLEGELAQSIATLDAVSAARVHLSIAKSSSFVVSDGSKSSASVVVTLKPGRQLAAEQIAAIIKLVADSATGLDPQRVSLVDQSGRLLSAQVDLSDGFDPSQGSEAARRFQDETRRGVRDLLAPVLGEDNYRVSVTAEVDNDRVQETHERYGDTPRITNEAMREESGRDPLAVGVPGSLSNRPVAVQGNPPQNQNGQVGGAQDASTAQKNATTRQYAYDRSITQIQRSRGRLEKLNVAVVLNAAAAPGGAGWTQESLADVERLLRSGLGINAQRGDTLAVSAMAFPAAPEALPWWQERDNVIDATNYAMYALAALLAFFLVVRPLLRLAQQRWAPPINTLPEVDVTPEPAALAAPEGAAAAALAGSTAIPLAGPAGAGGMPVRPLLEDYDLPPPGSPVDVMVDHLKVLAGKEPERVAEVVKQWVQNHGRSEQAG